MANSVDPDQTAPDIHSNWHIYMNKTGIINSVDIDQTAPDMHVDNCNNTTISIFLQWHMLVVWLFYEAKQ